MELPTDADLATEFGQLMDIEGGSRRDRIRRLARKYGVTTRAVYDRLERAKFYVK
jgi:hypothetical protein